MDEEIDYKDSFAIGTPATGGTIRVYFNTQNAVEKITTAKKLYYEFVEKDKIRTAMAKKKQP